MNVPSSEEIWNSPLVEALLADPISTGEAFEDLERELSERWFTQEYSAEWRFVRAIEEAKAAIRDRARFLAIMNETDNGEADGPYADSLREWHNGFRDRRSKEIARLTCKAL